MPIRPENRDRYPSNWSAISLRIRTVRAAGRCECVGECGRGTHVGRCPNVNGGTAYGTGSKVVLTVAHLNHTPEDCRDENLRAMCQECHLHYDRDHHRQTAAATRRAEVQAAGQLVLEEPPAASGCDPNWRDSPAALNSLCEQGARDLHGTRPEPHGMQTIDPKGRYL